MPPRLRGVLNVNKPGGLTSYDVIRQLKPLLPGAKLGHAGTLDPMAEGVLLVLVNEATKVAGYLMTQDKEYEAEVLLGRETDTDDITGQTLRTESAAAVTAEQVTGVLGKFKGLIRQTPPAYSAVKVAGERSYKLARQGMAPDLRARKVLVNELSLLRFESPLLWLRIQASGGTYIRSLARDIGRSLGCGGTLKALTRTRSSTFNVGTALAMSDFSPETVAGRLVPVNDAITFLPLLEFKNEEMVLLWQGKDLSRHCDLPDGSLVRAGDADGRYLVIARYEQGWLWSERGIYADV
jgi:tRNA pseudouridine55 synthase